MQQLVLQHCWHEKKVQYLWCITATSASIKHHNLSLSSVRLRYIYADLPKQYHSGRLTLSKISIKFQYYYIYIQLQKSYLWKRKTGREGEEIQEKSRLNSAMHARTICTCLRGHTRVLFTRQKRVNRYKWSVHALHYLNGSSLESLLLRALFFFFIDSFFVIVYKYNNIEILLKFY